MQSREERTRSLAEKRDLDKSDKSTTSPVKQPAGKKKLKCVASSASTLFPPVASVTATEVQKAEKIAIIDFDGTLITFDSALPVEVLDVVSINPHVFNQLKTGGYTGFYICTARVMTTVDLAIVQCSDRKNYISAVIMHAVNFLLRKHLPKNIAFYGVSTSDDVVLNTPPGHVFKEVTGKLEKSIYRDLKENPFTQKEIHDFVNRSESYDEIIERLVEYLIELQDIESVQSFVRAHTDFKDDESLPVDMLWKKRCIQFANKLTTDSHLYYSDGRLSDDDKTEQLKQIMAQHPHATFEFFDDKASICDAALRQFDYCQLTVFQMIWMSNPLYSGLHRITPLIENVGQAEEEMQAPTKGF